MASPARGGKVNAAKSFDAVDSLVDDMHRFFSKLDGPFSCVGGKSARRNEEFTLPENLEEELGSLEERIVRRWEGEGQGLVWSEESDQVYLYLRAIDDVQNIVDALIRLPEDGKDLVSLQRAENILHQAMSHLEEGFKFLLEKHSESVDPDWLFDSKTGPSFSSNYDDRGSWHSGDEEKEGEESKEEEVPVAQPVGDLNFTIDLLPEGVVSQLAEIVVRMARAGYMTECSQGYIMIRKMFLEESVFRLGFEKISIEEVQKIQWELLEVEISKWMQALKVTVNVFFASERKLCDRVFAYVPSVAESCFGELAKGMIELLNFGEAVAISRRAPEKLFKILDMYETLRDLMPEIDSIFSREICSAVRSEAFAVWMLLGEAARGTFVELETAIQGDVARNPVPGGAIHPLTRYVMNYMRLACDYRETLEQVFREGDKGEGQRMTEGPLDHSDSFSSEKSIDDRDGLSPLSIQTIAIMDLLESNLDAKSRLYKDPALSYVFLMNNGRYIVQKVKDSEIHRLLGDDWVRKHSSNVRQYHKNYQRVAWGKILSFLKDEGIHVSGNFSSGVSRQVLKERFKNFNASFEEIHKTQSAWIIGDEQLQTELRISIAEMVIPAYRSFLGRFQQYIENGRHSDKYIKYAPEDLETLINELFEGPSSMGRRRSFQSSG
uniref:Exocyst subunit Exo70 family protein n=1 Tax=Wollemia nobilis TaxID=56998 RepID=A0A0C9S5F0_9CONI